MNELDYTGQTVLVVGGSSGIGNGIAQRFRTRGADVHITGTKPSASDYAGIDGANLEGLTYSQLDVVDPDNIERFQPPFDKLDVLIIQIKSGLPF